MWQAFTPQSTFIHKARLIAVLYTLIQFVLCLWPGQELPSVSIPMIDKWTHFVMFSGFCFLWLCAYPSVNPRRLLAMFLIGTVCGWVIELLQKYLTFLGRYYDTGDILANMIGCVIGILLFLMMNRIAIYKGSRPFSR